MLLSIPARPVVLYIAAVGIIFGAIGISGLQIQFLVEHFQLDFIPGEVSLEEDIAIVVAAFGVFLDNRKWIIRSRYGENPPEIENLLSAHCQKYGVALILLGIFIEVVDLGFLAINNYGFNTPLIKYGEVGFLFTLNVIAIYVLGRFLGDISRLRLNVRE